MKASAHLLHGVCILALIAAAVAYQLFCPPLVGMADNGDFARLTSHHHIFHPPGNLRDQFFGHFVKQWSMDTEETWESGFYSSECLLIRAALLINAVAGPPGVFDIRCLATVHTALFLLAIWLLLIYARSLGTTGRLAFYALLSLIVVDVAYVAYFNSFYSESASLIFFLFTAGFFLLTVQQPRLLLLAGFALSSILFLLAKQQNVALGAILAVIAIRLCILKGDRAWRLACAAVATVFVVTMAVSFQTYPAWSYRHTHYQSVFTSALVGSPDPGQDLIEMGLDPAFAKWAGTSPFTEGVPRDTPEFENGFYRKISLSKVILFYAKHPARLYAAVNRTSSQALGGRPEMLGNFEAVSGFPKLSKSRAFCVWSSFLKRFGPARNVTFLALFGLMATGMVIVYRRSAKESTKVLVEAGGALILMSIAQLVVVTISMGSVDVPKQLFLFALMLNTLLIGSVVWLASYFGLKFRRDESLPGHAPQRRKASFEEDAVLRD